MNTLRIPLIAFMIGMPLIVGAAPTVKIISPTKSPTTNGVLNASGTASGAAPVAVFYSFNGSGWAAADGTTNWSVTNLPLTPGSNVFSAYVQDATLAISKTNTVKFIYVVNVPITVLTNGNGTANPNYDGKLLEIGKKYSLSAKAAKGFGFSGWLLNGDPFTNAAHFSFTMASNLIFTANFHDSARPLCVITFPAVNHSVSNSPITVMGRASDNLGVTAVNYQLNGGGWNTAALDDPTDWEADNLALNVGANAIQAFAMDAAGNVSLTNTVNFNYVSNAPPPPVGPAPASLAGTVGEVMVDGDVLPFFVSFGLSTFAQASTNGNEDSNVGNYSYTLLSSNMAQLNFSTILPPQDNKNGAVVSLTFTDNSNATFTDTNGHSGSIIFSAASSLAPSPSAIITAQYVGASAVTNTIVFGGGGFTNTDGSTFTNFGTYTLIPFSPQDVMLIESFTDDADAGETGYVQLDFLDASNGNFFFNGFDSLDNFLGNDSGTFSILDSARQPAGNAPDSPAGLIWNASPTSGAAFQLCFGPSTYSRTSSDASKNEVGLYSYTKTGPNTAQFTDVETEPLLGGSGGNGGNGSDLIDLTFANGSATVFQNGVKVGTIKVLQAQNVAPASIAGKTITAKFGFTATITVKTDGTFTVTTSTGSTDSSGIYTYSQYSPITGMLVADTTASTTGDVGKTSYVELTFTSSSAGKIFITTFDSGGNFDNTQSGTFTVQ